MAVLIEVAEPGRGLRMVPRGAGRLLRIELRNNAMLWLLPVAAALFWWQAYRSVLALPPMWNLRAMSLQNDALLDFAVPVTAAAGWMGGRERRRRISEMLTSTARVRWARNLATWAATASWALAGYAVCVAVVYVITARQASGGGPLWWPVIVGAFGIPALTALGFTAGALAPGRFTTPLLAIAVFFALGFSFSMAPDGHSPLVLSPLLAGAPQIGADQGIATFYPYLPDLSIAQIMFLAGLTVALLGVLGVMPGSAGARLRCLAAIVTAAGIAAAGTAVALAGTARQDPHGMLVIPALHDAASDQPVRYTPVCGRTAIPVCMNPLYAAYLPAVTAALAPVLSQVAGLPGAPAEVSQTAVVYTRNGYNGIVALHAGKDFGMALPGLPGFGGLTATGFIAQLRDSGAFGIAAQVAGFTLPGFNRASQAQLAVAAALAGLKDQGLMLIGRIAPGSPVAVAAGQFAALPAAVRHAWLMQHLPALRAGKVTLAQLP
jgi:hypothetical protein